MDGFESRRAAAFAVAGWIETGKFAKELLPDGPCRSFAQDLAYTAIRRRRAIEFSLKRFVKSRPDPETEAILLVGAAQMLFMPEVPAYAAVAATVEAAKRCGKGKAGFVNAVLRNMIRSRDAVSAALAAAAPDVRESFPAALYRRWKSRYGEDGALELMRWHNLPAETFLAYPDGRFEKLPRAQKVSDAEGYGEGKFIVQDPGTALAVELVDPKPGEKILDLCAAPGGKTIQMAWRGADVTACEVNPARRERLLANLARAGLSLKVVASPGECAVGAWDKILVDAPCGNTGVIRRRPEARWSWSEKKMESLVAIQSEILDKAASLVRPGGAIVYSTCSNEPEENSMQTASFLSRHPGFSLKEERENVPHLSRTDGSYAALLELKSRESSICV